MSATTAPEAARERFLAAGDFVWMEDIARTLRSLLGSRVDGVPTRKMSNVVFRAAALVSLRSMTPLLGRRYAVAAEKARTVLGFSPRPVADTVGDCAASLLGRR